jgi:hypothetical protein
MRAVVLDIPSPAEGMALAPDMKNRKQKRWHSSSILARSEDARRDGTALQWKGQGMSHHYKNIEHSLTIIDVHMLETLVRKEINHQIKERPNSINQPDSTDTALHELLEKLERCYHGVLYEHPNSDDLARLTHSLVR